jgi:hypothetical protein
VFGLAPGVVDISMARQPGTLADAEEIVGAALSAFGQGAGRINLDPPALDSLRQQFIPKISSALEGSEWREHWDRERVYLVAYAEALGQHARTLANEDRRTIIVPEDIHHAATKLRGWMPVAGRWCPL